LGSKRITIEKQTVKNYESQGIGQEKKQELHQHLGHRFNTKIKLYYLHLIKKSQLMFSQLRRVKYFEENDKRYKIDKSTGTNFS